MKQIDVSIVVPALNEENYIEKTLKALKAQDFEGKFEIIVADGDSEDKTVKIAKKYADKVVIEKTRTIAAGRQSGCRVATGKIIVFTDADSKAEKNWLRQLVEPFKDAGVVGTFGTLIFEEPTRVEKWACKTLFPFYLELFNWLGFSTGTGSNLAVRRDAYEHAGGFNVSLTTAEDIELLNRVRRFGKILFNRKAVVWVSPRRIRKWGWWKFFWYHAGNFANVNLFNRGFGHYEAVR